MRTVILLSGALAAGWSVPARAQPSYALGETVALQPGWQVVTYRDLDGDARPDLVVTTGDHTRIEIHERRDVGFALVATLTAPTPAISYDSIGDIDGDGVLELAMRGLRSGDLYLVEASGDDRYRLRRFSIGPLADPTCIGDSDGDGRLEVIAGQPGFPSRLHRFEAVANDRFERLPVLAGVGGSTYVACAPTGHPDSLRVVFADNHFWYGVMRGMWLDASGRRGEWPRLGFVPTALVDTDGDGRLELIGRSVAGGLIIADVADRRRPRIVVRDDDATCSSTPGDFDGDGRVDFLCTLRIDGASRVVLRARRGGRLITTWDGAALLPASSAPHRVQPVGDWNGDGRPEIIVVRGGAAPRLFVLTSAQR